MTVLQNTTYNDLFKDILILWIYLIEIIDILKTLFIRYIGCFQPLSNSVGQALPLTLPVWLQQCHFDVSLEEIIFHSVTS